MSTSEHAFLDPQLTAATLDRFFSRSSILRDIRDVRPRLSGTLLDVGCGYMPYRSLLLEAPSSVEHYLGLDLVSDEIYRAKPDLTWDGITIPLPDQSVDCALATEVLEHCPEPSLVVAEIFRVLKPGGVFFFTVPFLWPLHDVPYDHFRYTPFALFRLLDTGGFDTIEIRPRGGWDASLGQMLGLWVRRRPMSRRLRRILSLLALPLLKYLYRADVSPKFEESPMIAGLSGTAYRPKGVPPAPPPASDEVSAAPIPSNSRYPECL
jgi:SAM-dependent methyltransferase